MRIYNKDWSGLQMATTAQRLVWNRFNFSTFPLPKMAKKGSPLHLRSTTIATASTRKLPILLFDVMDTLVRDPFYHDIPNFFGMSMKELLECKHPTAWIEFEKGLIDEMQLAQIFFKDGRPVDMEGLRNCVRQGYSYIEGVKDLLDDLKENGYEMHAATNYPIWYEIIEEKLKPSTYLSWTFCSCTMGKRKPDPDYFLDILEHLRVDPTCCVFIDDRLRNVEAARNAGFTGIQFKDTDSLRHDLTQLGIDIQTNARSGNPDSVGCSQ